MAATDDGFVAPALPVALGALNATYHVLQALSDTATDPPADPCAYEEPGDFTLSLHVGGVFAVLFASALGAAIPLLAVHWPKCAVPPFAIVLGKCVGTGVVLACGLIHMLQPSNEALTSPCLPTNFTDSYSAYAYLFAMLAGLGMHFLDDVLAGCVQAGSTSVVAQLPVDWEGAGAGAATGGGGGKPPITTFNAFQAGAASKDPVPSGAHASHAPANRDLLSAIVHVHASGEHEASRRDNQAQLIAAALMLEFGVGVHSILIGLAVGVLSDSALTALLVALCFHQFFEGVALGSRLADAGFSSHLFEATLCVAFAIAAPTGMAVGVGLIFSGTLNPSSTTYLFTQGTLDGVCGGILLYLGYALLTHDFPEDAAKHAGGKSVVSPSPGAWRRWAMFIALWLGAGLMAFIGKYL